MGLRFFKRITIAPGVTMNISKSGPSFSFGPRGMKYTVGAKGTRTTFGIPGTGLYYTKFNSRKNKQPGSSQLPARRAARPLPEGFGNPARVSKNLPEHFPKAGKLKG